MISAKAEARASNADSLEPPLAIVPYDLWQQMFGGRDEAIGTGLRIGRAPANIVGVLPRDFSFPGSETAESGNRWRPIRNSAGRDS